MGVRKKVIVIKSQNCKNMNYCVYIKKHRYTYRSSYDKSFSNIECIILLCVLQVKSHEFNMFRVFYAFSNIIIESQLKYITLSISLLFKVRFVLLKSCIATCDFSQFSSFSRTPTNNNNHGRVYGYGQLGNGHTCESEIG